VTPRFLEALACGCRPIMRYPDNPATRHYRLSDFGPSVDTYAQFEAEADHILSTPLDLDAIAAYLAPRYTSQVIKSIV
ncbi:MAG: glycosyltransferase family 1 protein, partial [Duncaniella sp.]|nr:glycosyltransferase family 1 protein [Duncaniella sp.]